MIRSASPDSIDDPSSMIQEADMRASVCDICAAGARVKVLSRYSEGAPLTHHYCLGCADHPRTREVVATTKNRSGIGTLLVCAGGLSAVLAACVDRVPGFAGVHPGYGFLQGLGIFLGFTSIALGAILKVDLLAICGATLTGLTFCADAIVLDRSPGVGWKQALLILASLALVLFGRSIRAAAKAASQKLISDRQPSTIPDV